LKLLDEPSLRGRFYVFKDRLDAGERLALKLKEVLEKPLDGWVLAIPAGGVPVGFMVARRLGLPLDVLVVRKVQVPWDTEAGFGAVGWDGTVLLNQGLVAGLGLTRKQVEDCVNLTKQKVFERLRRLRGEKPFPNLNGKLVILVDDGLATGYTMLTAVRVLVKHNPGKVVVAVPTGSMDAAELLVSEPKIDMVVCLNLRGGPVFAVADAYKNWYDLTDEEVLSYLKG
jgi:predicted phosphoribosyltransferase